MSVPKIVEITYAVIKDFPIQDTIVQGTCRKKSQQRVWVQVSLKFCHYMFFLTLP